MEEQTIITGEHVKACRDKDDRPERCFHGQRVPREPVLSIVTPTYNAMPYLAEAIESTEALGEEFAFEHVVADGASTDGSVGLLSGAEYVRGVSQPDDGLYSALNWTLRHAHGRYVQWLNADDLLCPNFTRRAVELLEAHDNIDLVLGSTLFIDAAGVVEETWRYEPYRAVDLWACAQGYFFNINSAVFRTDLLRSVGDFDQSTYPTAADIDFEMRLLRNKIDAVVLDEPAYVFRRHASSRTSGEDAPERVMQTGWRLFETWSMDESLDTALRRAFALRAMELRLGWCFKRLRTFGRRAEALGDLVQLLSTRPRETGLAAKSWLDKKFRGGFVPMKSEHTTAADEVSGTAGRR
ncbi:glycosyltransferase [Persicimonas caeni]|uniref:Glycosyltransferase n=1 Tax=Persicimonas caeni TaxID=2292766 RepID=A0A4Y6PTR3_PERCE|nr:glycosyltransferase [Persicimonas caeni]QDG51711.1 glycosyltransferase [Persicimonas caeni]QED32932.1 glycosyltransferase [Persicimonas caeni]